MHWEKQLTFTVRQSLSGISLIGEMLIAAQYAEQPPSREFVEQACFRMAKAAQLNDVRSLYRDTLLFAAKPFLHTVAVPVDLSNLQFIGAAVHEGRFAFGYEPEILCLMECFLPKNGVFYDIGANWGYFVFHLLTDSAFTGSAIAVEPVAGSARDFRRIAETLAVADRVRLIQAAAGEKEGIGYISRQALSGLSSLRGDDLGDSEQVRIVRLDSLGIPVPDFIKIDVEEYELQALSGLSSVLEAAHPPTVLESWFRSDEDSDSDLPLRFLADHGYKLYAPEFIPEPRKTAEVPFEVGGLLKLTEFDVSERKNFQIRLNVFACCNDLDDLYQD